MKQLYKKRSRPRDAQEGGTYDTRRRGRRTAGTRKGRPFAARRRNRRAVGVLLVACALLALVVVADYLVNEGEILRAVRLGGPLASGETELAVSGEEVAENQEAVGDQGREAPMPTVLLGEFFTDYAWDPDPDRQANLRKSAEAIDGTLLAPGEEFSAIEVLEPLEYEPAKVFANGGVDYVDGGGLCQISSTLYMAANYVGLEIVERNQHYAEVPYIKPGLDATVWFGENGWGALDMKFENNTDGYILIREFVNEEGFLVAQIYGEKPTGKVVSMDSEKLEEDLNKGIKWATYKKVTDKNGKVVQDGLLYESVYSYNPPVPPELKHEINEPRGAGWVDPTNTTNWNKD